MDTNSVERSLKRPILNRKNAMFFVSFRTACLNSRKLTF
ncbi:MAG: hypothetical protein HQL31_03920 [Planctomycetes bacterium]|nr:hypothetical protein [Planctomycetota bacterium]